MRLLLDTHALVWALGDDPALSGRARALLEDAANEVHVSVASLWEAVIKARRGKLRVALDETLAILEPAGFRLLDIRPAHLHALARLPVLADHRDPFDHLLIAQAIAEDLAFMTEDRHAPRYPVAVIRCRGT